jgi:Type IV pilin-like G and H, putative
MAELYFRVTSLIGLACVAAAGCAQQPPVNVQPSPSLPVSLSPSKGEQPASVSPSVSQSPSAVLSAASASPAPAVKTSPSSSNAKTPSILGKLKRDISPKVAIARQDSGKTSLSNVLLSQQSEKLVKGRFNPDLKRLPGDIPLETDEYRLEVRLANKSQAIIVAIAKQPGFSSYTGAVYALEGKIPASGICKTNVPSRTPPLPPKLDKVGLICGAGSSTAN